MHMQWTPTLALFSNFLITVHDTAVILTHSYGASTCKICQLVVTCTVDPHLSELIGTWVCSDN